MQEIPVDSIPPGSLQIKTASLSQDVVRHYGYTETFRSISMTPLIFLSLWFLELAVILISSQKLYFACGLTLKSKNRPCFTFKAGTHFLYFVKNIIPTFKISTLLNRQKDFLNKAKYPLPPSFSQMKSFQIPKIINL